MKTVVLGASPNPQRYSYAAARRLLDAGHEICLIGKSEGIIFDHQIHKEFGACENVDTVTIYLNPDAQKGYYETILDSLAPRRIIFNPGTENLDLIQRAEQRGILVEIGCTLVMLATGTY